MFRYSMAGLLVLCSSVWAKGEGGLYADVAPAGSTFIRVINSAKGNAPKVSVGKIEFSELGFCKATDYVFMPKGEIPVIVDGVKTGAEFKDDTFYTVVLGGSEVKVIEDPYFENKRKALVSLYNLRNKSGAISLKAKAGTIDVVSGVSTLEYKDREINAVTMQFDVFESDTLITRLEEQSFTRGDVFSVFACGEAESAASNWAKLTVTAPSE